MKPKKKKKKSEYMNMLNSEIKGLSSKETPKTKMEKSVKKTGSIFAR